MNTSIDRIALERGVSWEFILHEVKCWLDSRRQQESFKSFDEAVEAWSKR